MMHMEGIPDEFKPAAKKSVGSTRLLVVMGIITAFWVPASILMRRPERWLIAVICSVGILTMHAVAAFFSHRRSQQLVAVMRRVPMMLAGTAQPVQIISYQFTVSGSIESQWLLGIRPMNTHNDDTFIFYPILIPSPPPEISEPAVAEEYQDGDHRLIRLEDGTLLLASASKPMPASDIWMQQPPRPIPWIVRVQLLTFNGSVTMIVSLAFGFWALFLKPIITEWPLVHLPFGAYAAIVCMLGVCSFITWWAIAVPLISIRRYRLFRDATFGYARIIDTAALFPRLAGYTRKDTFRVRIRDEAGREYEQTITTWHSIAWRPGVEIPVLFDPQQKTETILLDTFTGLAGYCAIDADGKIVADIKRLLTCVLFVAIGILLSYCAAWLALSPYGR
jgi:hypothetical protein